MESEVERTGPPGGRTGRPAPLRGRQVWKPRSLAALVFAVALGALLSCTGEILEPEGYAGLGGAAPAATVIAGGCPVGQLACVDRCVDPAVDPMNCGGCGRPCGAGLTCQAGACRPFCATGDLDCGGACVSIASDSRNCGGCGRACPTGQFCSAGNCSASCALSVCAGPAGAECVDMQTSSRHCGACGVACPTGQSCASGGCGLVCPTGLSACAGGCVDTLTSSAHCGRCDAPCAAPLSCVSGVCACAGGQAYCGGACVDVLTSTVHCGRCDTPCGVGQSCQSGLCVCPGGLQPCAGGCVDTTLDNAHCGGCDRPCGIGTTCVSGTCTCAGTESVCDGACVDTGTNPLHCGTCNRACFPGESCVGGACQGPVGADGCNGAARGMTLDQIAVYQSIKIPVMQDLQPIGRGARVADVVQRRQTLFRVFVELEAGWVPREISARLTLVNGGVPEVFFAKQVQVVNSSDGDPSSTFLVYVPPEKILVDTRYAVELVECGGTASGGAGVPRFPATGDTALEARQTGVLKIRAVPVRANSQVPDTSDAALAVYRDYMTAMYPAESVEFSVATEVSTGYPINWTGLLDQMRSKRQADAAPADVYYYGLIRPEATFSQFCGGGCTAGIGYVGNSANSRAAVGVGWADAASASTMAHEVGHNHGRNHAPCAQGSISGIDQAFPHPGGVVGVWGYDSRSRSILGADRTDIMGYCQNKWVSDYTYQGFVDRVASVNGAPLQVVAPERIGRFLVVLVDSNGARWGIPFLRADEAFGDPEAAEILDASGAVARRVTVYRTEMADGAASTVLVPPPEAGWHSVRVAGGAPLSFSAPMPTP